MTLIELREIASQVECEIGGVKWQVRCELMGQEGFIVQVCYEEVDEHTGAVELRRGKQWYVSWYSHPSEVIRTILTACLASAEHLVRKNFKYQGVPYYKPPFEVDDLAFLIKR